MLHPQMNRLASLVLLAVAVLVASAGCQRFEKTVDERGGRVRAEGLELEIPPDALSEQVKITITREKEGSVPSDLVAHSALYRFEPEGLTFAKPVEIRIDDGSPPNEARIYWTREGSSTEFEPRSTARDGTTFVAKVSHFSSGFVGQLAPGACLCSTSNECCNGCRPMNAGLTCGAQSTGEFGYCGKRGECIGGGLVSLRPTESWVNSVAVDNGGLRYAFMDGRSTLEVRQLTNDSVRLRAELGTEVDSPGVLAFDITGSFLAAGGCRTLDVSAGCTSGYVMVWRMTDGVRVMNVTTTHPVATVAVSQNRFVLAGGCAARDANRACTQGFVELYHADNGVLQASLPSLAGGHVGVVSFSVHEDRIAAGGCASERRASQDPTSYCQRGRLNVWELDTRSLVRSFPMDTLTTGLPFLDIHALAFLADGSLVASNWDVEQAMFGPIQNHFVEIYEPMNWLPTVRYDVGAPGTIFIADDNRRLVVAKNGKANVYYTDAPELVATYSHPNFRFEHFSVARNAEVAVGGTSNQTQGIQIWQLPPIP